MAEELAVSNFGLPDDVLAVIPSDPYEQLDVARKITSIALATRVSKLESESTRLRSQLAEKADLIAELQAQLQSLDASLSETADKLSRADEEKERLVKENSSLSSMVKKLNRDVSKLEIFRKTLMQSLQEDGDGSQAAGTPQMNVKQTPNNATVSSTPLGVSGEEDATILPSKSSSIRSQFLDTGNSITEASETDASTHGMSHGFLLASHTSTPRLTPPGSPPSLSVAASPTIRSKPVSPRRHSISFSTSRSMFDDRSSVFSSLPSSHHGSISSSSDMGSQTGRTRVDGKEFFRQVRNRLSYEQFGAFLANVKELNSHKQTREETLRKADEIFGPDNKDLFVIFEGLITRNVH